MSSNGVPLQEMSDTVGRRSSHITGTVYRHVIVPAIRGGESVMDTVFGQDHRRRKRRSGCSRYAAEIGTWFGT